MRFLLVTVFLISLSYHGKSEKIRCYCNLEECISNNFLCSYEDGGCFSHFLDYRDIDQAKHGCLHLLKRERQEQCGRAPGSLLRSPRSILFCCKTDLCNQVLGPASLFTHSLIGSLINATEAQNALTKLSENKNHKRHRYADEVWFQAVNIAIPIFGVVTVFLLVAVAFKILRADHLSHYKHRGKAKTNANCANPHLRVFRIRELTSKNFSKEIPLLCETQHNCENFRKYTSARIHFGQKVNSLRNEKESCKVEKNVENEKINLGKLRTRQKDNPQRQDAAVQSVLATEDNSNSTLDVRVREEDHAVLPTVSLKLDKPENLNNYNLYNSIKTEGPSVNTADFAKVCDKRLL